MYVVEKTRNILQRFWLHPNSWEVQSNIEANIEEFGLLLSCLAVVTLGRGIFSSCNVAIGQFCFKALFAIFWIGIEFVHLGKMVPVGSERVDHCHSAGETHAGSESKVEPFNPVHDEFINFSSTRLSFRVALPAKILETRLFPGFWIPFSKFI